MKIASKIETSPGTESSHTFEEQIAKEVSIPLPKEHASQQIHSQTISPTPVSMPPKKSKKMIAAVIIVVIVIAAILSVYFLFFQDDAGKFIGTWQVSYGSGSGDSYVAFYENGSAWTVSSYSSQWNSYWIDNDKLYIANTGGSSYPTPGYDYSFSNGDRQFTLSLGGVSSVIFTKVDVDLHDIEIEPYDWDSTPTIAFMKTDMQDDNTLTVVSADPSDLYWEDFELQVDGVAMDHNMVGTIIAGDEIDITSIAGTGEYTINIRHMPTNTLIASFDFTGSS